MVPDPSLVINDVNVTSLLLLKIIDMLPTNLILLDTLLFIRLVFLSLKKCIKSTVSVLSKFVFIGVYR